MINKNIFTQNGSALVICLLSLAVMSALGTGALLVSTTNQTIAGNYRKQSQAFYVAEAGLQMAMAAIKNDITWRGDTTSSTSEGNMIIGSITASYTVTTYDASDDGNGIYEPLLPGGYLKLVSEGVFVDSTQTVESIVSFSPDGSSTANSPDKAVITSGDNTGSGSHVVNGYDDDGNVDPTMVDTYTTLPTVNQNALKTFADFSFSSLGNGEVDGDLSGQSDFWKDAPDNTQPYIVHVSGNLNISGNRHVYGIIFVEGSSVVLSGSVRIHGVVYAPNATVTTTINGGGSPGDQPVMGQVISGAGGVHASGNHADVQLVKDYVDAFNNFGGADVNVDTAPGTWRQY
ncbi:MAG: pilus assembly PilX N-terminal domain-containing protein [Desulfotignum sp.]|nr:pilus assembly PilX N-terminal domain-containing protein [Desulfotignum sp.]